MPMMYVWVVVSLSNTYVRMSETVMDSNIALAGVCQAAALVQQVARKGQASEPEFEASLNSIVITDPDSTEQVFGSLTNLRLGLETLIGQLGNQSGDKDAEITRYIASILGLERKLSRKPKSMQALGERISQIQRQQVHMQLMDSQMLNNLASVYSDVISPVGPKIQVAGNPSQLQLSLNQHKVRALLLAGVRAAVLWRQLGGKRRHILFGRRKILASAENMLHTINTLH